MELPLEGRVSNALVEVGPSITLASLSEVLAFAVGSFIPMPACRVFSMFAGQEQPDSRFRELLILFEYLTSLCPGLLFLSLICFLPCSIGCFVGLPSASYCICCLDLF